MQGAAGHGRTDIAHPSLLPSLSQVSTVVQQAENDVMLS